MGEGGLAAGGFLGGELGFGFGPAAGLGFAAEAEAALEGGFGGPVGGGAVICGGGVVSEGHGHVVFLFFFFRWWLRVAFEGLHCCSYEARFGVVELSVQRYIANEDGDGALNVVVSESDELGKWVVM